ncbi:MAG: PatB family C-S lyase [Eubacteriales bacterium]
MNNHLVKYSNRRNTDCVKWDLLEEKFGDENLLPLWVADMDFEVPDCVKESLQAYIETGVFGYYKVPQSYDESFMAWEEKYFEYKIEKEWIHFSPGVVPAVHQLIKIMTEVNDSVIVLTPVYYPFFDAVNNNHRNLIKCPLHNNNEVYTINFELFEEEIIANHVKVFISCSPHNPIGRVWTKEELLQLYTICQRHGVKIISDEIHQDIVMKEHKQLSLAALTNSVDVITVTACTKTFNLATCQNSFIIIPDEEIREKYQTLLLESRIQNGSGFGYVAVESGYRNGRPWLEEVLTIIEDNYMLLKNKILESGLPITLSELEGTYLAWMNLNHVLGDKTIKELVQDQAGLAVDFGDWFGDDEYKNYIRLNLATVPEIVEQAITQLLEAIEK